MKLLSQAFSNVAVNGKAGRLRSLALEVAVYRNDVETKLSPIEGGDWRPIWEAAAYTYCTAVTALAQSGLTVEKLEVFSGQWRCSVASNELSSIRVENSRVAAALSGCRSLSISLSNRVIEEKDKDAWLIGDPGDGNDWTVADIPHSAEGLKAQEVDESNFASLLQSMPKLEELNLHRYALVYHHIPIEDLHFERLLQRVSEVSNLQLLRKCRLAGLWVTERSLLAFLQQSPRIKHLSLENIKMKDGKYRSIFDHCTSEAAAMEHMYFDDLFEELLLYFDEPGHPKFPSMGGSLGTNTLTRDGPDVRQAIGYHFTNGRSLGSPQAHRWRRMRQREYGPP